MKNTAPVAKKLLGVKLELWPSASAYMLHGIPWWERACMFVLSYQAYNLYMSKAKEGSLFARGIYDKARNLVVLCLDDIGISVHSQLKHGRETGKIVDDGLLFSLQMYYTLVHELLHSQNVTKGKCANDHSIDFDKYEKLPMWLKMIFDDFLKVSRGDSFSENNQ